MGGVRQGTSDGIHRLVESKSRFKRKGVFINCEGKLSKDQSSESCSETSILLHVLRRATYLNLPQ
jgi:hypothetical protein